ncbi:hypothetical protein ACQEUU_34105 [Nonomuraea sp. CA-218870]|uniref:hypothetical protein n=1 Tax=Nonomuraea sp. CA-218870 TaxID=3239998 RepID=UPI003D8C4B55
MHNLSIAGFHTYHVAADDVNLLVHNTAPCYKLASDIKKDSFLVREAKAAGASRQRSLNQLLVQIANGNFNSGIGGSALKGTDVVGKANKRKEDRVIARLKKLYG